MKLPLRKEKDALDERDDRSDRADGGRLPWKDDHADGGRKLMVGLVYSLLRRGATLVSLGLWATRVVVLYSHLFVGARGCPGGVGALRMFLRRLARSYGPLLGSNCGVDFVDGRSKCATRALGSRASSRRTHKSGREAPRYYSWRFRRAGLQLKGPPVAEGRLDRTPSPQQLEEPRMCNQRY